MVDREFERFVLEQVRRGAAVYYGIMIAFGCSAVACVVMAVAALIIYGWEAAGTALKILLLFLPFAGAAYAARGAVRSSREAAEEIAYGLDHPECNIPDDYLDGTKAARRVVFRNLRSIRGLIISYGIIALMLWGATLLIAALSGIGTPDYSPGLLFVAFLSFCMALPLTILTIAYIQDLPDARRYRQCIKAGAEEEQDAKDAK